MTVSTRLTAKDEPLADHIDALLPQTQCGQCGYAGCRPYAEAIADGAAINQCPPGGAAGVRRLAALLGRAVKPLARPEQPPTVARIDEAACIGCTLCIQACPVDAIIGAARQMHSVVAAWCTGCALCLPPCPTECIDLLPTAEIADDWRPAADQARARFAFRQFRKARDKAEKTARLAAAVQAIGHGGEPQATAAEKEKAARQAIIQAAIARAKAQREAARSSGKTR
jgi:electron transport complex protein RnfB